MADNKRDPTLFNTAIDNKLRGCDLVCLKVRDVFAADNVKERASVTQSKTRKARHAMHDRQTRSVRDHRDDPFVVGEMDRGPGIDRLG